MTAPEVRERARRNTGTLLLNLLLWGTALIVLVPFVWMITAAFKPVSELFAVPFTILPKNPTLKNIEDLFASTSGSGGTGSAVYPLWYLNSVLVAVVATLLIVFFCSLGGFAFSKYRFRGRGVLLSVVLGSIAIPFIVVAIPMFIIVARMGLLNTHAALILPFVAPAFGLFLMTQYMRSLPDELLDAARIDGAGEFRIYRQIVLPLVRPALGALAIFMFLQVWNAYFWPLLVMNDPENYTLPLGLASLRGENLRLENYGRVLAGAALASVPMVVFFLVLQRQFIGGLTAGAVKS